MDAPRGVLITGGASAAGLAAAAALRARGAERLVLFSDRPPMLALPRGTAWAQGREEEPEGAAALAEALAQHGPIQVVLHIEPAAAARVARRRGAAAAARLVEAGTRNVAAACAAAGARLVVLRPDGGGAAAAPDVAGVFTHHVLGGEGAGGGDSCDGAAEKAGAIADVLARMLPLLAQ